MESSIAVFLKRLIAFEQLPTFRSCLEGANNWSLLHGGRALMLTLKTLSERVKACNPSIQVSSANTKDFCVMTTNSALSTKCILAEGAIALPVTLSGGALFAS